MDNVSLLLALELEESRSCYPIAYHLVETFISHTLTQLIPHHPITVPSPSVPVHSASRPASSSVDSTVSQQKQSLCLLLLGSDGWERDARYDSSKHHGPVNLPLATAGIFLF